MNGLARKVYLLSRLEWNGDPILQDKVRRIDVQGVFIEIGIFWIPTSMVRSRSTVGV